MSTKTSIKRIAAVTMKIYTAVLDNEIEETGDALIQYMNR
jgi:hypothetical protein